MAEPSLAVKFGLNPDSAICLLDAPAEALELIRESLPPGVQVDTALSRPHYDTILFWPQSLDGLAQVFAGLQARISPAGAIWAILPKKRYAARRGIDFTWEQMQAAGLQTDLVDNKIASITEQDYGTRFVIRKERRPTAK